MANPHTCPLESLPELMADALSCTQLGLLHTALLGLIQRDYPKPSCECQLSAQAEGCDGFVIGLVTVSPALAGHGHSTSRGDAPDCSRTEQHELAAAYSSCCVHAVQGPTHPPPPTHPYPPNHHHTHPPIRTHTHIHTPSPHSVQHHTPHHTTPHHTTLHHVTQHHTTPHHITSHHTPPPPHPHPIPSNLILGSRLQDDHPLRSSRSERS